MTQKKKKWETLLEVFSLQELRTLLSPNEEEEQKHFLSLIINDLSGAYNNQGIHQWFFRSRKLLKGKSPADLLKGKWTPDSQGPRNIKKLAETLKGK